MQWEKVKNDERRLVPYRYQCRKGDMTLELCPPYINEERHVSDPWLMRLYIDGRSVMRKYFRLRGKSGPGVPESLDDLEKAQEEAFRTAIDCLRSNEAHYRNLADCLESMKE